MSERTAAKAEHLLEHTSVRPAGNNPFRWANPQRIAVDLLREDHQGFLSGAAAVQASFSDVRKHLIGVSAGMRSALHATMEALSPKVMEARVSARPGLFLGRAAAAWREYVGAYQRFWAEANQDTDGLVNREFRAGYARRSRKSDNPQAPTET
jgi:type VI secretion system FHA domain protein